MKRRVLAVAAILSIAACLWWLTTHEGLEAERLREAVAAAGPWGPILFVVLFSLLEAFGVPGIVFIGLAIVAWPPWQAFLLIWCGSVGAGCVGFVFARTIGRRWVAAHLPDRFRALDVRLATSGLRYVIAVRLLFYLATPAHWILGLSGVPIRTALLGSAIGFLPASAAWAFAGGRFFVWVETQSPAVWVTVAAGIALLVLARVAWGRRRAAATLRARAGDGAGI